MSRLLLLAGLTGLTLLAHVTFSTRITWSREISRIVQARCLSCHREPPASESKGGFAPIALDTYEAARPWAKAIQEEVLTRRMPPWGAVKGFGEFAPDPGLTQEEVQLIAEWVEGGAPEGDPSLLPEKRRAFPGPARLSGVERTLSAWTRLPSAATLLGFRTSDRAKVIAELPDGSREPLLWVIEPAKRPADYILARPRRFPAATVLVTEGGVAAVFKATPRPRQKPPNSPGPAGQTAPKPGVSPGAGRSR
jgi:hypothetical protein